MYERLRNLREDNDLSQTQVAEQLAIAQTTYSGYECGNRSIPIPLLVKLAQYYHTSVDYLLGLTDEKEPYPRSKPFR